MAAMDSHQAIGRLLEGQKILEQIVGTIWKAFHAKCHATSNAP
jgi:hypothetical protein